MDTKTPDEIVAELCAAADKQSDAYDKLSLILEKGETVTIATDLEKAAKAREPVDVQTDAGQFKQMIISELKEVAPPADSQAARLQVTLASGNLMAPPAGQPEEDLDYASVDGNAPPDFVAAKKAGAHFVVIRRSVGYFDGRRSVLVPDPVYARDAQRARDAGLVVGAYLFPIFHVNGPSAQAQVAAFDASGGEIIAGRDLPPVLDVEFPGNGIADTGMTQGQAHTLVVELVSEIVARYGVEPIIYTSHVEWCDTNGLGGPVDIGGHVCPLWIKIPYPVGAKHELVVTAAVEPHYGFESWDKGDLWRIPPPWTKLGWWLRQKQGDAIKVAGFTRTVDVDDFNYAQVGTNDPRVAWAQLRLAKALGFAVVADGSFGPKTEAAVKSLQTLRGLEVSGRIDPPTLAVLAWIKI